MEQITLVDIQNAFDSIGWKLVNKGLNRWYPTNAKGFESNCCFNFDQSGARVEINMLSISEGASWSHHANAYIPIKELKIEEDGNNIKFIFKDNKDIFMVFRGNEGEYLCQ